MKLDPASQPRDQSEASMSGIDQSVSAIGCSLDPGDNGHSRGRRIILKFALSVLATMAEEPRGGLLGTRPQLLINCF